MAGRARPGPIRVPSVRVARARYAVAREAGHGIDCAMAFARGISLQRLPPTVSPLEHCVCGLRRAIVRRTPPGWRRLPDLLLSAPERYERARSVG